MSSRAVSRAVLAGSFTLFALLMLGCGFTGPLDSGAGGATQSSSVVNSQFRGQVVAVVKMPITTDLRAILNSDALDELAAEGLTVTADSIVSKEKPLQAHWVSLGDATTKTDDQGIFGFDSVPSGATARVFQHLDDTTSETTFPGAALARDPATPPLFRIELQYKGPIGMQPGEFAPFARRFQQALPHAVPYNAGSCTECALEPSCDFNNPKKACCLDVDGNLPGKCDQKLGVAPLIHTVGPPLLVSVSDCVKARKYQFIGSTCWKFVFEDPRRPCANEGALIGLGIPNNPFIDCFSNHGFRNCQSVVPDDITGGFDSTDGEKSKLVPPGSDPVNIGIHNNGWDKFTRVRLRPDGAGGTLRYSPPGGTLVTGSTLRVQHFNATTREHIEDQLITYTPPADQPPDSRARDTIEIQADNTLLTLTAFLKDPCELAGIFKATFKAVSANMDASHFCAGSTLKLNTPGGLNIFYFANNRKFLFILPNASAATYNLATTFMQYTETADHPRVWKAVSGSLQVVAGNIQVREAAFQATAGSAATGGFLCNAEGPLP